MNAYAKESLNGRAQQAPIGLVGVGAHARGSVLVDLSTSDFLMSLAAKKQPSPSSSFGLDRETEDLLWTLPHWVPAFDFALRGMQGFGDRPKQRACGSARTGKGRTLQVGIIAFGELFTGTAGHMFCLIVSKPVCSGKVLEDMANVSVTPCQHVLVRSDLARDMIWALGQPLGRRGKHLL